MRQWSEHPAINTFGFHLPCLGLLRPVSMVAVMTKTTADCCRYWADHPFITTRRHVGRTVRVGDVNPREVVHTGRKLPLPPQICHRAIGVGEPCHQWDTNIRHHAVQVNRSPLVHSVCGRAGRPSAFTDAIIVSDCYSKHVPSYPIATNFRGMETVMEDQRPRYRRFHLPYQGTSSTSGKLKSDSCGTASRPSPPFAKDMNDFLVETESTES